MRNDFDENKAVNGFLSEEMTTEPQETAREDEHTVQVIPDGNIQSDIPESTARAEQPQTVQNIQNAPQNRYYTGYGYTGQPAYGGIYIPPPVPYQGQYGQPAAPEQKKRRFGAAMWIFAAVIVIAFAVIVVLCAKIAANGKQNGSVINTPNSGFTETQPAGNRPVIKFETAERPVLEDEMYADKETGLLTTVGVAKVILPSQVQVKSFGDIPYEPLVSGSGIILTEDGYILTNSHVIGEGKRASVKFYDGTTAEAVIIGTDTVNDIAIIKADKTGLTPAQLGTSTGLSIGEEVALAGAGGGYCNTVNYGHITGLEREIKTNYSRSKHLCIQSDAALNFGNSGGALVNMYGQVIGIPIAVMDHETYESLGFSIAIDDVIPIAEELIANGYVSENARMGIYFLAMPDGTANSYDLPAGLCIMDIDPDSYANEAGMQKYDILTHVDDKRICTTEDFYNMLREHVPGDVVEVVFVRKEITGEVNTFRADVKLIEESRASDLAAADENPPDEPENDESGDGNDESGSSAQ